MATGPDHYRQAEHLLSQEASAKHTATADRIIAEAQVHATLALAAATAELDAYVGPDDSSATGRSAEEAAAWADAFTPAEVLS